MGNYIKALPHSSATWMQANFNTTSFDEAGRACLDVDPLGFTFEQVEEFTALARAVLGLSYSWGEQFQEAWFARRLVERAKGDAQEMRALESCLIARISEALLALGNAEYYQREAEQRAERAAQVNRQEARRRAEGMPRL